MLFSHRKGYKSFSQVIQHEGISEELRNSLWNVLTVFVWQEEGFLSPRFGGQETGMDRFSKILWLAYFKKPIDTRSYSTIDNLKIIRDYFFTCEWYEVYDFLQFTLNNIMNDKLIKKVNLILEQELAAYRFVDNVFTDITDEQEIEMMNEALCNTDFPGVSEHLKRALELLSDRKNPDYRNSIKESISAVESLCQSITGNPNVSLGDALKKLHGTKQFHPALLDGFVKIYGYTSNEGGIRHAMMNEPDLSLSDAKFFLISCTSFINYLKSKL